MSTLEQKLMKYAEHNLNVMLIGSHGIGKSTIVKDLSSKLGTKFKYYSSSTLDPWSELIGIPVPDAERKARTGEKVIDFYRPHDLDDAEFVFFDELNRVTNPRVLQTVLEIIQFKSINGTPLKNLKMVWAAINPPGEDYQVEELDPALIDRFHVYIKMNAYIDLPYMKTKMREPVAKLIKDWWDDDMDDEQRRILTPRRIEYIGWMIDNDVPWRDAIPQGHTFPLPNLERRIRAMKDPDSTIVLTREVVLNDTEKLIERMEKDPQNAIKIADIMTKFNEQELFSCRDLLEKMPQELIVKVGTKKFRNRRVKFKELFEDASLYPKISKGWKFEEL